MNKLNSLQPEKCKNSSTTPSTTARNSVTDKTADSVKHVKMKSALEKRIEEDVLMASKVGNVAWLEQSLATKQIALTAADGDVSYCCCSTALTKIQFSISNNFIQSNAYYKGVNDIMTEAHIYGFQIMISADTPDMELTKNKVDKREEQREVPPPPPPPQQIHDTL